MPDDAGIATALTFEAITLDGERTYEVSEDLIAFDTYNLQLEPVLRRRGQYVHVGLEGSTMVWMAGISAVVPADDRVSAYYTGVLTEVEGRRAFFRDGTVLELSDDIHSPEGGTVVEAEIDTASDRVVGLTSRR